MSRPASPFGIGTGGPAPAPGFAGFGARRPAACPAVPTLLAACIAACIVAGSLVLSEPAIGQSDPGGRHADPALERLLPTTLGGTSLTVESQDGKDLMTNSATFDAFLAGMGKTRADFSLASAYSDKGLHAAVGSWRVRGGEPGALLAGFKITLQASSATPLTMAEEAVGGAHRDAHR